ncbi:MAG: hypothetical protein KDE21_13055 [Novosphingobium sp.]|nr:hypothetical protein [Novosphingobium sp.]
MRRILLVSLSALAIAAAPAVARDQDKPITDREPDAVDVATTPVTDLNLKKDEIPKILIDAQTKPYDLSGLSSCGPIVREAERLDNLLGDDFDLPQNVRGGPSAGRVAKSVVGSFIPFRGIIREVSGANEQQRKMQAAIQAGIARRGFLKGVGQARGCRYPARPASRRDVERIQAERARAAAQAEKDKKK